jgi:FkbM family methyltransferase
MKSLLFPFYAKSTCSFTRYDGSQFVMPTRHWPMLAAACRLLHAGASVLWRDDEVEAHFGEYCYYAPADSRLFGLSIQGIFVDDAWRFRDLDLDGKIAVSIGGYIGIVAVALAKKGATVHVFEPFEVFVDYIRRNAAVNDVADKVIIHPVGLSDRNKVVVDHRELSDMVSLTHGCSDRITSGRLVNATEYFENHAINNVSLLEMNCEGCEYHVLTQDLIDLIRPERIHMEYHNGIEPFIALLHKTYTIQHDMDPRKRKGILFAKRA